MKKLLALLLLLPFLTGVAGTTYSEVKYKVVAAGTTDTTGGVIIPEGVTVSPYRFIGSGAYGNATVLFTWCYGTGSEKIFSATRGDVNVVFEKALTTNQVTGNGSCKFQVVIINAAITATPVIGGLFEVVEI